jgi:hypothetical protein
MMKRVLVAALVCFLAFGMSGIPSAAPDDEEDVRMTQKVARGMLGTPAAIFIDVRSRPDWEGSPTKIKGSVREDPQTVPAWMNKYPKDKTLILYCS